MLSGKLAVSMMRHAKAKKGHDTLATSTYFVRVLRIVPDETLTYQCLANNYNMAVTLTLKPIFGSHLKLAWGVEEGRVLHRNRPPWALYKTVYDYIEQRRLV